MIQKKSEIEILEQDSDHYFSKLINRKCLFMGEFAIVSAKENQDSVNLLFLYNSELESYSLVLVDERITAEKKTK